MGRLTEAARPPLGRTVLALVGEDDDGDEVVAEVTGSEGVLWDRINTLWRDALDARLRAEKEARANRALRRRVRAMAALLREAGVDPNTIQTTAEADEVSAADDDNEGPQMALILE